jgi:hypothetical protein
MPARVPVRRRVAAADLPADLAHAQVHPAAADLQTLLAAGDPRRRLEHLDLIRVTELPVPLAGCEECLKSGDRWLHLRMCETCGKIGCCDSSPNRHASRHALEDGHPIARSAEPGETWSWCYVDEVAFEIRTD